MEEVQRDSSLGWTCWFWLPHSSCREGSEGQGSLLLPPQQDSGWAEPMAKGNVAVGAQG